jgi:very-short-patch-repair endonuclease
VKHQFELPLGNFIYDLGLLQHKILVEFDGKDHTYESQRRLDERKDRYALNLGWTVKRVVVAKGAVISPVVLSGIVA